MPPVIEVVLFELERPAGGPRRQPAVNPPSLPLLTPRTLPRLAWDALEGFQRNGGTQMAASLSFYALLSLAPMVILALGLIGLTIHSPGQRDAVVAGTPFARIGLTVCYDVRFAYLYRMLAQAGAELITVPAAFTKLTGEALTQRPCRHHRCPPLPPLAQQVA